MCKGKYYLPNFCSGISAQSLTKYACCEFSTYWSSSSARAVSGNNHELYRKRTMKINHIIAAAVILTGVLSAAAADYSQNFDSMGTSGTVAPTARTSTAWAPA